MGTCTVNFRDGTCAGYPRYKRLEIHEGWITVTDEYDYKHTYPRDVVKCIEQSPGPRL